MEIILSAIFFTVLGVAYVKGYDAVKGKSPDRLPQFYLIMATIRMVLVLTVVGLYALLSDNRDDTIKFALTCVCMYTVMMVVTLWMRH